MLAPVYGLNSVDTHIARAACCEYGDASGPNSTAGITIYNTGNIKTSFTGGGAHLLPQLLTAAQDIRHESSSCWFDRTADLRVLMHGGPAPAFEGKSLVAPVQEQLTPAAWLKGCVSWLDRDANAQTRAYGRAYNFNLDREPETFDIQVGIDMGTRDVLGAGDALVFGVLGGFVHGDLDYDNIARRFQYDGGQVGAYANYLAGGLFVDTLLNAHIYELDANNVAFPGSVDGNTVRLRTDTGYRFGSLTGGTFIEPLATIEVMWADLDGFAVGGNRVKLLGRSQCARAPWFARRNHERSVGGHVDGALHRRQRLGESQRRQRGDACLDGAHVPVPGQSGRRLGRSVG